ncbi:efflux transporter outer membrane subunit [bacterium]|nr:efflux transporter outer membrane subunit [bacterium]
MKTFVFPLLVALVLAGCSVGPDFVKPDSAAPSEWQSQDTVLTLDSVALAAADTGWWELFGDTVLTSLIRTALQENNDVRIAASRVEEYMGLYGVTKSDFFPKIGVGGSALRGQGLLSYDVDAVRPTRNIFDVNVSATWEIDLWGKIRRATEAARANLLAAEEARRGVVLSIVGLVADSYIDLLSLDKQLAITRSTASIRKEALGLFQERYAKGDVSELELSQIESQYWLAVSDIPALEREIAQRENALNVLLGRNPGPIPRGTVLDSLPLVAIPEGIPSRILEQRPDVRQAEEQLRSANAQIGVAKSAYYPSISLTGLFGFASTDLSNLFTTNARVWNVGGQILQPIFRWGEISGQVDAAEAFQKQTLFSYVQTGKNAFRDVEDALVERSKTEQQQIAQEKQVQALRTYGRLANMRYKEGVTSYLEVLDADRNLFSTELQLAQTQARLYRSIVGAYRAFGGGWVDNAAQEAYLPGDPVERREEPKQADK